MVIRRAICCMSIPPFHSTIRNTSRPNNWLTLRRMSYQIMMSMKLMARHSSAPSTSRMKGLSPSVTIRFPYDSPARFLLLEAVADAMFRQDIDGVSGIDLHLAPKLADVNAGIVDIINVFTPPHLLQQIALRDDAPGILDQHRQQFELGGCEVNFDFFCC